MIKARYLYWDDGWLPNSLIHSCVEDFYSMESRYDGVSPYRHEQLGLGWICQSRVKKDWRYLIFFDEPPLLIQELKAAEFEKKGANK